MQKLTLLSVLAILCLKTIAQSPPIKPLSIGDTVPDITINNIINYKSTSAKLSDFKDKLLILDFMATGCISCIEKLPRYDSLAAVYKDQLAILIVSSEPQQKVETFFTKNPIGKVTKLPMASQDSLLSKLFPHAYISHEVWIKNGIVTAITGSEYVVNKNIQTVLNEAPVNWPVKREVADFDYSKPIVHINEETIPSYSYPSSYTYSAFTENMQDIPRRFTITTDTVTQNIHVTLLNLSVIDLYRFCYGQMALPLGNIILNVKDTSQYVYYEDKEYGDEWRIKNTYCYETRLPSGTSKEQLQNKIASDLDFNLGIRSSWEIIPVKCLLLVKKQKENRTHAFKSFYNSKVLIQKHPATITTSFIVYFLNQNILGVPIIDETGLNKNVILDTAVLDFSDLSVLNKQLGKYGLEMKTAMRPQKMLTITEARENNTLLSN